MNKEISDLVIFITASTGILATTTLGLSYLTDNTNKVIDKGYNIKHKIQEFYKNQINLTI